MSSNFSGKDETDSPDYFHKAHWKVDSDSSTSEDSNYDFDSLRMTKDTIAEEKLEHEVEQAAVAIERRISVRSPEWDEDVVEFMENDLQNDRERLIVLLLKKICSFRDPSNSLFITCFCWFCKLKILTSAKSFMGNLKPKLPRVIAECDEMDGLLRSLDISTYTRDFIEEEPIGSGGFGAVFRARHKVDGRFYAVKKIMFKCRHFVTSFADTLLREVQVLSRVTSSNITRYYGAFIEQCSEEDAVRICQEQKLNQVTWTPVFSKENESAAYNSINCSFNHTNRSETSELQCLPMNLQKSQLSQNNLPEFEEYQHLQLFLLMEFCGYNTLWDYISSPDRVTDLGEIMSIMIQCMHALKALHSLHIVHRDVKPGNIFLKPPENIPPTKPVPYFSGTLGSPDESKRVRSIDGKRALPAISECVVKLGDFGLSKFCDLQGYDESSTKPIVIDRDSSTNITSNVGTRLYAAPEISEGSDYGVKVDIYSLGIIFFELLNPPFVTMHERVLALSDLRSKNVPSEIKENFGQEIAELLERMVDRNSATRASVKELLEMNVVRRYIKNRKVDPRPSADRNINLDLQEDEARMKYASLSKLELIELMVAKDRILTEQKMLLGSKERPS